MSDLHNVLVFATGEPFATSASGYLDQRPEIREPLSRIYVKFIPQGTELQFVALLDTGGHYCILNSNVAQEIESELTEYVGEGDLRTAHGRFQGKLFLHQITLVAETGPFLDVDVLVLAVPDWLGPNFLGYSGALDRINFPVSPRKNMFFFGPADGSPA